MQLLIHVVILVNLCYENKAPYYSDVIMSAVASQITGVSLVCSGEDQRKHQSSVSLVFVRGVNRKMFSFDDAIMGSGVPHAPYIFKFKYFFI